MIGIDTACRQLTYYSGKEMSRLDIPEAVCETMTWNAGVVAGVSGAYIRKRHHTRPPERTRRTPARTDTHSRRTLCHSGRTRTHAAMAKES